MANLLKWDADEIEDFYEKNIKPKVEPGYFPSYKFLFQHGYIGFYLALFYGKTKKYPDIKAFCDSYWLKRATEKKMKWTKEYADEFYHTNIFPHVKDWLFPVTNWFKNKWWEYWGFICSVNSGRVEWYSNVKDFKVKNGLKSGRVSKLNKEEIDEFYRTDVSKYIENNMLPTKKWFQEKKGKLLKWLHSIESWTNGYKGMKDFSDTNWLDITRRATWNKDTVDQMFEINIRPLTRISKRIT